MQPIVSHANYRKKAYAEIASLHKCLKWLEADVLGEAGANWARLHSEKRRLTRSDFLLKDLNAIWPTLIVFQDITPFSVTRDLVSLSFLQNINQEKILDYIYPIVLGRPPDDEGVQHYRPKLGKGHSQNRLINDFILSKEAKSQMKNIIVDNRKLSELRRAVTEMSSFVYFKNATRADPSFFERTKLHVARNETNVDWYFLYKDETKGKHLLSPGVNLVGDIQSNGQIQSGPDWVLYGPKIPLSSGSYALSIDMKAGEKFSFHLDACCNAGLNHYFDLNLSGSCNMTIDFQVSEDVADFEFRLLNTTNRSHSIDIKLVNLKKI